MNDVFNEAKSLVSLITSYSNNSNWAIESEDMYKHFQEKAINLQNALEKAKTPITVEELKRNIEREVELISEDGVTDEHGNWNSKEEEEKRLRRLHSDLVYFMREYS